MMKQLDGRYKDWFYWISWEYPSWKRQKFVGLAEPLRLFLEGSISAP